jgi:uncharacterized membrane protein
MDQERACGLKKNVGETERMLCVAAGGWLLLKGIFSRRKFPTILGGALVYRGFLGHCQGYQALGIDTTKTS